MSEQTLNTRKACFFIHTESGKNSSHGGHSYSIHALWQAYNNEHKLEATLIHLTNIKEHFLCEYNGHKNYFEIGISNPLTTFLKLNYLLKSIQPDFIFSISPYESDDILRILSWIYRIPLINCKPGGQFDKFWLKVKNLVIFMEEDLQHYTKNPNVTVIRNRVLPEILKIEDNLYQNIISWKNDSFLFLRISRFAHMYKNIFIKSINMINKLVEKNYDVKMLIIGYVNDQEVLDEVKLLIKEFELEERVLVKTDITYTADAKKFIPMADAIVGVGRGAIEACLASKPVLGFIKEFDYPVPLSQENKDIFLYYNFSTRTKYADGINRSSLNQIELLLTNKQYYVANTTFCFDVGETEFNVNLAPTKIQDFAEKAILYDWKETFQSFKSSIKRTLQYVFPFIK